MRGKLITLFSVITLASAATVDYHKNDMHRIMPRSTPDRDVNCDPREAKKICRAPGSEGVLVAHEICNQFYKCSHGEPVALKCPKNLLYNSKMEYCDWPENVDCGDRLDPKDDDEDHGNEDHGNEDHGNEDPDKDTDCGDVYDDPSQAPAICAKHGSDGILVAHENCTQFYECANGHPVSFCCPSGLLYNPKTKRCDWYYNVDCGDRKIPANNDTSECNEHGDDNGNNGNGSCNCNPSEAPEICAKTNSTNVLVAHEKCNKYYICLHGIPVSKKCPRKLLYNPYREQCDWPKNVECDGRIIPEDNDDNDNEDNGADIDDDAEVEEDENHHGHWDPSEAPAICAKEDSDGVLIAHEICNYFYTCLHGRPYPVACPHGLHFNPRKHQCDWPNNVLCKGKTIPNGKEDNGNGVTEKEREVHSDPSKAPKICAKKNSDGVLVAHEKCNRFYQCSGGKPIAMKCAPGLLYNPRVEKCDWPINVNCSGRIKPHDKDDEEPKEDEEVTKKPVIGYDDPSQAPGICAEEGSDDILVANEKCNKFYICAGGVPVAFKCPNGTLYNPKKEECDWPDAVICGDRTKPGVPEDCEDDEDNKEEEDNNHENNGYDDPKQAPEICAKEGSDGILISHEYCTNYYICVNNHPITMKCPRSLFFNPKRNECDWPQNVTCKGKIPQERDESTNCNDARNVVLNVVQDYPEREIYDDPSQAREICARNHSKEVLVSHEYCHKYYQCVNGRPVTMRCPTNLFFDARLQKCEWRDKVNCGNRIIPDEEEEGIDSEEDHEHIGNNHDDPSLAPYICAEKNSNGVYVAHEYCNKYYICFSGHPVTRKCPSGLYYNPKSEVCDWLWRVECNERKIPELV